MRTTFKKTFVIGDRNGSIDIEVFDDGSILIDGNYTINPSDSREIALFILETLDTQ